MRFPWEFLDELLDMLPMIVHSAEAGTARLLCLGGAVERLTGYTIEECLNDPDIARRLAHPDDYEAIMQRLMAGFEYRKPFAIEYRLFHRDGRIVWFRTTFTGVWDDAGKLLRHHGVTEDITELKRAREGLEARVAERTTDLLAVNRKLKHEIEERRQAEAVLRRQAEIIEQVKDSIVCTDLNGFVTSWNRATEELYGYSEAELLGTHVSRFHEPDIAARLEEVVLGPVRKNGKHDFETRVITKDGELRDVRVSASLLHDDEGRPVGIVGCSFDLTDVRRAEEALRTSEARFRSLYDGTSTGIAMADPQGNFIDANPAFCAMVGYSVDELRKIGVGDVTHPDDMDLEIRLALEVLAGKRNSFTVEKRYIRKDGAVVWGRMSTSVARDASGEPTFAFGTVEDITEHKQAEQRLHESEARFRAFVEAMPDVAFVLDEDGRYVDVVASDADLLYRTAGELKGRLLHDVFPPDAADVYLGIIRRTLETGTSQDYDYELPLPSGKRWFEARTAVIATNPGAKRRIVWVARDVTERNQAVEKLRQTHEQLQATLGALPDLLFEVDRELRFRDFRAPQPQLLYAPAEDFLGRTIEEVLTPEAAAIARQACEEAFQRGSHTGAVYSLPMVGGERWYQLSISVKGDRTSPDATLVVMARDITDTRQAEGDLRASETKYRTLVESLNIGIMRANLLPEPAFVHANPACIRIFGCETFEELERLDVRKIAVDPSDHVGFVATLRARGVVRDYRLRIHRKDGGMAIIEISATGHYNEAGEVEYLDAVIEDITEQIEVEQRLTLLSTAVEQSTEGICVVDPGGHILFANEAMGVMHGLDTGLLRGRHLAVLHDREQDESMSAVLDEARRVGRYHDVHWHVHSLGKPFPVLRTISAIRNDVGEVTSLVVSALDISDRFEAQLRQERLSHAVENAGEGIGTFDADGVLTYANPALSRIFGTDQAAVVGRRWEALFSQPLTPRAMGMRDLIENRERWAGRLLGRDAGGGHIPLAVTLARLEQPDGRFLVIANIRDQSDEEAHLAQIRKLTLEAASSLEQERARLSRELHDELGQMLTAINLNLAWLSTRGKEWAKAKERLAETQQLVNQMLDAVRTLSTSLRPPILDNQGLLEAVRSYANGFARRAGFSCRVTARPSDLEVRDPLATTAFRIIQEALTNVARHARASKCGIFLKVTHSQIEITVRDNGVGAVPSRLHGVQSLGIAGMRERAAAVGGTLQVENRTEGGVCVTALLPWCPSNSMEER